MKYVLKNQLSIKQYESYLEKHSIGKTKDEIELLFDKKPDHILAEEWIYIIEKYFFGLFSKNVHLFFKNDIVCDFYIGQF